MKIIYEDKYIKVSLTNKRYDFIATIENKRDYQICIVVNGEEICIESNGWVGILADNNGRELLDNLQKGNMEIMEA